MNRLKESNHTLASTAWYHFPSLSPHVSNNRWELDILNSLSLFFESYREYKNSHVFVIYFSLDKYKNKCNKSFSHRKMKMNLWANYNL